MRNVGVFRFLRLFVLPCRNGPLDFTTNPPTVAATSLAGRRHPADPVQHRYRAVDGGPPRRLARGESPGIHHAIGTAGLADPIRSFFVAVRGRGSRRDITGMA